MALRSGIIMLVLMLSGCQMFEQQSDIMEFERYDYDTHDPATLKLMEETLEQRNMSLDAELDEIRLEKRIPFPAER